MHGRKRFLSACALVAWAGASLAQHDAAEKAREGDIGHWIEYYRAGKRDPAIEPAPPTGARGKHAASAPEPARERTPQK